jgi:hypothetical protein
MKDHCASHVADGLNCALSDATLMVSIGATETKELVGFPDVLNKLVGLECATIREIILNQNPMV